MENVSQVVEQLIAKTKNEKNKFEQISSFDETIKMLSKVEKSEKPSYSLPLADTLGKQTYSNLNRK